MFPHSLAALFIIVEIWKLPKCSLMDEWIKKMPRPHTTIIQLLKEGNLSYDNMDEPERHDA